DVAGTHRASLSSGLRHAIRERVTQGGVARAELITQIGGGFGSERLRGAGLGRPLRDSAEARAAQPLTPEAATDLGNQLSAGNPALRDALADRVAEAATEGRPVSAGDV